MTIRQPQDREVIRRIEVSLPPHLLNELDAATSGRKVHIGRSRVIAVAIRRFLDEDGVADLPLYPDWP
jgi:metal-responsive CopG/Arc/MetJ family transcriptional regulator